MKQKSISIFKDKHRSMTIGQFSVVMTLCISCQMNVCLGCACAARYNYGSVCVCACRLLQLLTDQNASMAYSNLDFKLQNNASFRVGYSFAYQPLQTV